MTQGPSEPLYKGEPLDAARGPGLGCFWIQVAVLAVLLVLTPLSVIAAMPDWLSATLLIASLVLLLFTGQTVIFLLRLVAADRRTRRRPMGPAARRTVGDLEAGVTADDGELSWTELDLPTLVAPLYKAAVAEARVRLERDERVAPFTMTAQPAGGFELGDGDAEAADARPIATVTDARLRLPGLRRPTDAIRVDLDAPDGGAWTVAIRYESEGPPRYRYWPPVMAARSLGATSPPDGGPAPTP